MFRKSNTSNSATITLRHTGRNSRNRFFNFINSSKAPLYFLALPLFLVMNQKMRTVSCFFGSSSPKLERNQLENRGASLQYPANNPIEDRVSIKQLKAINGYMVAVLDGHGGYQVSEFAKNNLHQELERILEENKSKKFENHDEYIRKSIEQTFDIVEEKYLNIAREGYKIGFPGIAKPGSCALVSVIHDNKLYAANIGDCKGVIVSEAPNGKFETRKINHKLNANSKKEQARLRKEFPNEPDVVVCKRPDVCYVKQRLQPTRAFGDFYLKSKEFNNPNGLSMDQGYRKPIPNYTGPYITHKPQIKTFDLNSSDKYLVMATDGLWDELNKNDVAKIVEQNKTDKSQITTELFRSAFAKAAKSCHKSEQELRLMPQGLRRNYHDDISIIVVDLQDQFKK